MWENGRKKVLQGKLKNFWDLSRHCNKNYARLVFRKCWKNRNQKGAILRLKTESLQTFKKTDILSCDQIKPVSWMQSAAYAVTSLFSLKKFKYNKICGMRNSDSVRTPIKCCTYLFVFIKPTFFFPNINFTFFTL